MAIQKIITAETGTTGAQVVQGTNVGGDPVDTIIKTGSGSITIDATAGRQGAGTKSLRVTTTATADTAIVGLTATDSPTKMSVDTFLYLDALPAVNMTAVQIRNTGSLATLVVQSNGRLLTSYSGGSGAVLGAGDPVIAAGTLYKLALAVDIGATGTGDGTVNAAIYTAAGVLIKSFSTTTASLGTALLTGARGGKLVSGEATTAAMNVDDFRMTTGTAALLPAGNVAPTVNAGPDKTGVEPWAPFPVAATASDSDGTISSIVWSQSPSTPTPAATITPTGLGTADISIPGTVAGSTITFVATATDDDGATAADTMTVTVPPAAERILIGGSWVPSRTRIVTAPPPSISRVGEAVTEIAAGGTGTAITTALPVGIAEGDFLLLEVATGLNPTDLTDPAGWTPLRRTVDPGTSPAEAGLELWWKFAGASEAAPALTATVATRWLTCIRAFRGVHATTPFIAENAAAEAGASTTTVHSGPALTNTDAAAWGLFSMVSRQVVTPYTATPGAGLIERVDQDTGNGGTVNTLYFAGDSDGPVPTGTVTYSATGSAGSAIAVMWAGLLRPAP